MEDKKRGKVGERRKGRGRKKEKDLATAGSFTERLKEPELNKTKARSLDLSIYVSCASPLTIICCLLRVINRQLVISSKAKDGTDAQMICQHDRQQCVTLLTLENHFLIIIDSLMPNAILFSIRLVK